MTATRARIARFPFRMRATWRWLVLLFGVTPGRAWVELGDDTIEARFGPWRIETDIANVARWRITGPYRWWRAIGVRMTVGYWDVTFGSDPADGVCLEFVRPVRWLGGRHPALTVTVADPEALAAALAGVGIDGSDERTDRTGQA